MSSNAKLLSGPSISSAGDTGFVEAGSKYLVGDSLYLTAGHVAYEYDHKHDADPANISQADIVIQNGGSDVFSIKNDFRGYKAQYVTQAMAEYQSSHSPHLTNPQIEGLAALAVRDSVLISGSGSVTSSSAGLVLFLASSDLTAVATTLPGATVSFDGYVSKVVTGGSVTSATGGQLVYSKADKPGDSGGAVLLNYNSHTYVIGTLDGNDSMTAPTKSFGTYFQAAEWGSVQTTLGATQSGDVTISEPTDLIVGTTSADTTTYGSYRADILLGRDGNDILDGGDPALASTKAWASDQLYGGAGSDTFKAGYGNDLFHGGDNASTAHTAAQLAADGSDTADYSALTIVDPTKGVKLQVGGAPPVSTFSTQPDIAHAIYVTDLGRQHDTDTLISVELVNGTSADDVLAINSFDPVRLANASHLGGLYQVSLGAEATGDLIDFSGMTEGIATSLGSATPYVSTVADPSAKIYVSGAEQVLGSPYGDILTGGSLNETLRVEPEMTQLTRAMATTFFFQAVALTL